MIVPVYNDAARLALCLEGLREQSYPRALYELIVVDNGSTDDIEGVLGAYPDVVAMREAAPGSFQARNAGLARAKGEVIAFTDADCLPARGWLEAGVKRLQARPQCGFVGGGIELFCQDEKAPTAAELYDRLFFLQQDRYVAAGVAATANLFTTRAVIDRAGLFDAQRKASGDFEWCRRVTALSYRSEYAPDALVRHPARRALRDLLVKWRRQQGDRLNAARSSGSTRVALTIAGAFLPPLITSLRVMTDRRLPKLQDRARVTGVVLLAWLTKVKETGRLLAGAEPQR